MEKAVSMLDKDYAFGSKRLFFRGIREEDAAFIVSWRSDPENYRNFLNAKPITMGSHLEWFKNYLNDDTRYDFLISDAGGRPIGTCGLSDITDASCEISYMIGDASARGNGYATEAIEAVSNIAFQELGVSFIDARILPHNVASKKAAEKCGFREYEDVHRLYRR